MEKREVSINSNHGNKTFFADSVSILNNPKQFIMDFRNSTPRLDQLNENVKISIKVEHETIVLDPLTAKGLIDILEDSVTKYEKQFGKIKIPKKLKGKKRNVNVEELQNTGYIG